MAQITAPNVSLQTLSSARKTDDCTVCGLHYFSNSFQLGAASNLSNCVTFFEVYVVCDLIYRLHVTKFASTPGNSISSTVN